MGCRDAPKSPQRPDDAIGDVGCIDLGKGAPISTVDYLKVEPIAEYGRNAKKLHDAVDKHLDRGLIAIENIDAIQEPEAKRSRK